MYFKVIISDKRDYLIINALDIPPRMFLERTHNSVNFRGIALRFHFNRAVGEISHPAAHAAVFRAVTGFIAKSHALYVPVKDEVFAYFFHFHRPFFITIIPYTI